MSKRARPLAGPDHRWLSGPREAVVSGHRPSPDRFDGRVVCGSRAIWISLVALLAVILAGCADPDRVRAIRGPDAIVSGLEAAERGDLDEFLDSFDLDEAAEGRAAYETTYRVWIAEAAELEWEVVWTQPRVGGGQAVVVEVIGTFGDCREPIAHVFATNESGRIVYWSVAKELPGP